MSERAPPILLDSGSRFVRVASAHTADTVRLLDRGERVLSTQQGQGDNIRVLARNLHLLTRSLAASDDDLDQVLSDTPGAARELDALLRDLRPTLPVLLGNAVSVNQVVVSNLAESSVTALAGTTGLLLLVVFGSVNVSAFVLRNDEGDGRYFNAPTWAPVVGAIACLFLAGPWARTDEQMVQYKIAAGMVGVGVVLWLVTWAGRRGRTSSAPVSGE